MRLFAIATALFLSAPSAAHAQAALQSINLVQPNGKGRVVVPLSADRHWQRFTYAPPSDFSSGGPAVTLDDTTDHFELVYSLTGNSTNSAKDCRDKTMDAAEKALAVGNMHADVRQGNKDEDTNANGQPMATGTFFLASINGAKAAQQQVYGVVASREVCAEIHIVKSDYTAADDAAIRTVLHSLSLDAGYTPVSTDYYLMGALLSQLSQGRGYAGIAAYDQRALDTLPADAPAVVRRNIIDQLSTAYDRTDQADKGRAMNEAALKTDADYPMYYYNLARIDAEDFKQAEAKAHLQQAWDHKANLPAGQQMPDPTKDPSLQKLKTKSDFWSYVETLK